jgi:serine/threonine-protein kinase
VLRGTYRLEQVLGRGGTGTVYQATDLRGGRKVAVKVLRVAANLATADTMQPGVDEQSDNVRSARRFAREARIIAALDHPHIVKTYAFEEEDEGGDAFLAMELLTGETLGQLLLRRRLSPQEALQVYAPLCSALSHAHDKGIIHRDLKPDNVFLVDGRLQDPRVLDFGISKLLAPDASQLTNDTILGTPDYMAPELVRNPAQADVRSDVFALGAMLYHALTGHLPFEGESLLEVLNKVLAEEPPPLRWHVPDLPAALEGVVRRALARDPRERYQRADELLAGLRQAVEAERAPGEMTEPVPVLDAELAEAEEDAGPKQGAPQGGPVAVPVPVSAPVSAPVPAPGFAAVSSPGLVAGEGRPPESQAQGPPSVVVDLRRSSLGWLPQGWWIAALVGGGIGLIAGLVSLGG